jgi:hypothetical protein
VFTKEQADYYNSLTLDELVDNMIAKCGHYDIMGYFTHTPCIKCVREAHKKVVGQ